MDSDARLQHLEMIQSVISRMASNAFLLKGWAVTLVAALFALSEKELVARNVAAAIPPVLLFWGLDAYFLAYERRFRSLFDHVRTQATTEFSMSTSAWARGRNSWWRTLWSATLVYFYGPIAALLLTVWLASPRS